MLLWWSCVCFGFVWICCELVATLLFTCGVFGLLVIFVLYVFGLLRPLASLFGVLLLRLFVLCFVFVGCFDMPVGFDCGV